MLSPCKLFPAGSAQNRPLIRGSKSVGSPQPGRARPLLHTFSRSCSCSAKASSLLSMTEAAATSRGVEPCMPVVGEAGEDALPRCAAACLAPECVAYRKPILPTTFAFPPVWSMFPLSQVSPLRACHYLKLGCLLHHTVSPVKARHGCLAHYYAQCYSSPSHTMMG